MRYRTGKGIALILLSLVISGSTVPAASSDAEAPGSESTVPAASSDAEAPGSESTVPAASSDAEAPASESAEPASDEDTAIAKVGGTVLYYKDLAGQMAEAELFYRSSPESLPEESVKELLNQQAVLLTEALVEEEILRQKVMEYGIELTEEEKASVRQDDPVMEEKLLQAAVIQKLRDKVLEENASVPEEELIAAYEELLAGQKDQFKSDLTSFETAMIAGKPVAYVPEKYRVLKEVSLKFDKDIRSTLAQLKQLDTEEDDSYENLLAQEYERVEDIAKELGKKISDGEAPETAVSGLDAESRIWTNYITERSDRFTPDFYEAAMSISAEGETAEQVLYRDDSISLLYWDSTLEPGEIPFEKLRDQLEEAALKEKGDGIWNDTVRKWREETEVEIYEDAILYR